MKIDAQIKNAIVEWNYLSKIGYSLFHPIYSKEQQSIKVYFIHVEFQNKTNSRVLSFGIFDKSTNKSASYNLTIGIRCMNCQNTKYIDFSFNEYLKNNGRTNEIQKFFIQFPSFEYNEDIVKNTLSNIESIFNEKEIQEMLCNDKWLDSYFYDFR